jgi:hypothetical protein
MADATIYFMAALLVCGFMAALSRSRGMQGAAVIIAIVFGVQLSYAFQTGRYDDWALIMIVDSIAAWYVLTPPCSTARLVIGGLYIWQVVFSGVYGWHVVNVLPVSLGNYLISLSVLGWGQLAALFLGAAYVIGKRHRRNRRGGGHHLVAGAAFRLGHGESQQ